MIAPEPFASSQREPDRDPERVVVRDKRRLDPDSGELRAQPLGAAAPAAPAPGEPAGAEVAPGEADKVAELTADLQRVSAEYANYRKRVDRDRAAVVEIATAGLLAELLPLLDDIARARSHGDLDGAFKGVGEGVERVATKLGLEQFGTPGEPFNPAVHEALMTAEPDPAATVPTCAQVLQPGYRLASGRVLRPARVAVAEPSAPDRSPASGERAADAGADAAAAPTADAGADAAAPTADAGADAAAPAPDAGAHVAADPADPSPAGAHP